MDERIRKSIQGIAALLQNANFKGFFTGELYDGKLKSVCVPGLNCYSCPGATGACPIGSLQNTLSGYSFKFPYYVLGLLIFFGVLLGRLICGFLCPFGLLQELLNLIPLRKKLRSFKWDKYLRLLKYLVLIVMVIVLPICVKLTPFFCKYLCPSGTLVGLLLAFADTRLFAVMGSRFVWKCCVLGIVVLLSVIIYRPFCKYLCPLGALYGLFNPVSLFGLRYDKKLCVDCGKCAAACGMNVNPIRHPDSPECIRCGRCVSKCPTGALKLGLSQQRNSIHSCTSEENCND